MMLWSIWDLDGTLANCDWRKDFAARAHASQQATDRDFYWDEFHRRCKDDSLYEAEAHLLRAWSQAGHSLIYLTGRSDRYRAETRHWLQRHALPEGHLLMRPHGSNAPSTEYKMRQLAVIREHIMQPDDALAFVVEDDDRIVAQWRALGITCLQPRPAGY